ncbi:MAG: MFS transporter [SAR202 cluster bacterium]|nr:MFS transporter [SAR202 cluster bacterium]MQG25863.1 MFS transporter [SAR202 cluster bacterium]MQG52226.1 MFS transporter [SAR202 cluster bacterium]|tara:strand:- start:1947 stop:3239 length:1293 start_codon:yes stop_codon:yes gene_type:complete
MLLKSQKINLAQRLPFFYGWVVVVICCGIALCSRPLMSVAVLSIFMVPMTEHFGWSRGFFSAAVSLGGITAVVISPFVGRIIDKYGARFILSAGSGIVACCAIGIPFITSPWAFYSLYVPGRAVFASPLELGTSTSVSNWFIQKRARAMSILSICQGIGLGTMPFVAYLLIITWNWQTSWLTLGLYTLAIGVIPSILFMGRRPEDVGLHVDGIRPNALSLDGSDDEETLIKQEINLTLKQALKTRAFYLLSLFAAVGFMAQAGISLHLVAHFSTRDFPLILIAFPASVFALSQVCGTIIWSNLVKRIPVRLLLGICGFLIAISSVGIIYSDKPLGGLFNSFLLGVSVGGLHYLLRLAWANYYGRIHLGSIRGITLPIQITGQAMGPLLSGFTYDLTGSYTIPFALFGIFALIGGMLVCLATPPREPSHNL